MRARSVLPLLLLLLWGCTHPWDRLREWERQNAIDGARAEVERGDCAAALSTLERAQSANDLASFGAESVWRKALCLQRLSRSEEALAHWRLLFEQFPSFEVEPRVSAPALSHSGAAHPRSPKLPKPRYSDSARRSGVHGDVVVEYRVDEQGVVRDIRVVPPAHPLLASFAIEGVARLQVGSELRDELPFFATGRFRFAQR
jgi:tetratricopeptide (TPR) repeat protein